MKLSHRIARVTGFAVIVLFGLNTGCGQPEGEAYIRQHYRKAEYRIPMRDGVKLHTAVFSPRNTSQKYPFLMMRTPYGCRPYGDDKYPDRISLNPELMNKNDDLKLIVNAAYKQLAAGGLTITNFAVQAFVVVSLVIIIILYLIFLLLDFPQYQRDWKGFLPPTYREGILEFGAEFDVILRKYFRGQFIVAALTGISFAIGFSIVGLPMAVPFGLFVGLLNIVPYMQLLAIPPAFLLVLIDYLSGNCDLVWSSLYVAIVFGVVQLLQDGVFVPQIMT